MRDWIVIVILSCVALGCAQLKPSELPIEGPMVVVKDWQFSPEMPFPQVTAHHAFIDIRDKDGVEKRYEVRNSDTNYIIRELDAGEIFEDERETRSVNVRALITGPKALRIQKELFVKAGNYLATTPYVAWPGPNSNTFVETMLRDIPELRAIVPHLCYGKDFDSTLRAGVNGSKDGLEAESAILGAEIGLYKGVEVHLLQLTYGVSLFPPALKLPRLPPLGWGPATVIDRSEEYEPEVPEAAPLTPNAKAE